MEPIKTLLENTVKTLYDQDVAVTLTRPEPDFGDFASNIALQLAKSLGKNPRDIAEQIANELGKNDQLTRVEIAGPGFINLHVTDELLVQSVNESHQNENQQKVVIETNNPNPFKAMHIGHAFNAIVADTIANILEASGAETHRVSYHGDVGSHVGKSMYSLLKYVDGDAKKLDSIKPEERNSFMSKMYAEGAKAYKEDEDAKAEIDELAKQSFVLNDPLYRQVYETCKSWSFEQIDRLVAALGNQQTERRYLESQADALGVETVKKHVGDVFIESDGALVFPGSKYGIFDNVFVSSGGRGLYGARDLGLIQLKNNDFHAQKSYIVTAEEQKDYFRGVIKAAELCLPALKGVTVNIPHGTVKLTTGKMSSRSGDVLEVGWLFDQIRQALQARGDVDEAVVTGALRYQFLKVRVGSDIVFDVEEATQLQGNTGPYLQYAYARAASILRKSQQTTDQNLQDLEKDEHRLLLKISEFQEVNARAQAELAPHMIANYLYELTQSFNRFYEKNRVIDDPRQSERLKLVRLYSSILRAGLGVLGIPVLEKM